MSSWFVYGRTEYAEPLTERGRVEAGSSDAAGEAAQVAFAGPWVELAVIPESGMEWIVGPSAGAGPPS